MPQSDNLDQPDKEKLKKAFDISNFDLNAVIRGIQLTLVGAHRALQNPSIFTNDHYKQAAIAVAAGIAIRIAIAIPIIGIKVLLGVLSLIFDLDKTTWDDTLINGLDLIANHVLQIPLFLMTLMRYITPTLDNMFMDSLRWVDMTYVQKHKDENPDTLRDMYYPNLSGYKQRDGSTNSTSTAEAITMFMWRFARKALISLAVFALSYVPYIGRLVLPAASFYTFHKAVGLGPAAVIFGAGIFLPKRYLVIFLQTYFASRSLTRELLEPYFARVHFSKEQKRKWFRSREGLLFGFGIGFHTLLRVPLLGVLIYGIAEASTAYLITKITDPPPSPKSSRFEMEQFTATQQVWRNKHEFLNLPLANLDAGHGSQPPSYNEAIAMGKTEIRTVGKVSFDKPAYEQANLHNRWHPDIPFAGTIKDGETVKIECLDWTGGQIGNNDSADDIRDVDLTRIHYLTGPFEVEGAQPGDILLVEIMDVQPFQDQPWGFTGVFDKKNGGGFLDEIYPSAAKAIWDFEGIFATSRHIPHVKFAGLIHPGILGCAPSSEVLATWNKREAELISANKLERQVALPPELKGIHAGASNEALKEKVGLEGARTVPGRPEHGGNCDIKNLSRGSKVYLPVHVPGAKFSVGDLHFSQGDGEISFCGAIEMAGIITINFKVMKNGIADLGLKSPIYLPGPVEPQFGPGRYIYFEGFSVDEHGKQHYMDVTVAYRQTILRCIEYLRRFGYNDYQIYLLLSSAPVQGHVAGIVDIPNACTTLGLPVDIFDFDVLPSGPAKVRDMGTCAFETGVAKGEVTSGGKNSEHSFGGGLTYKASVVERVKEAASSGS
ncbi:formamidase [Annulohypoxylon maeteangense]|uniref:formamidase n=1 Tax=Annulohypoxylon maeteangense TaxID=1927788 RepID=UPI002008E9B4|nr:formamidase [Annulohypoxylon maeteangense]KAI0879837.1 formamidase [Annulohypoxylon maeteangense]